MNQEIKELTEQLRKLREKRGEEPLSAAEFSEEYKELVEEINLFVGAGRDRLNQEQAKMKMIHQVIASGMWSMNFDEEGNIVNVIWSPEFKKMLGFEDDKEFPERLESWSDRLHPDDKEQTMEAYWRTVHQAGKYDVEYRLLTKNGGYRWYHAIGETTRWKNGNPRWFIGVFIDITQRKEKEKAIQDKLNAKEALKKVKRELEVRNEILNTLCADFNSIYVVNMDTGMYDIYLMAESLLKEVSDISFTNQLYDVAMAQYISRWVSEEDAEFVRFMTNREWVKKVIEERKRISFRYRVKDRKDGQKNFEFSFCDISKKPGEHMVVLGARNVDALIHEKENYRKRTLSQVEKTLAGAQTGLWSLEVEEGKPRRMYGDNTMRKLMGIEKNLSQEEYYQEWFSGIAPEYKEKVFGVLEKSLSGEFQEIVCRCDYPKREKMYMRFGAVLDKYYEGSGRRLSGYYQDITETMHEKQLREEALEAALLEANKANRVKSDFLSHMSHDIRTPINGILGLLTIAEKEQNAHRQADCHQKIRKSAEHLLSLVNDVLDISKMESGKHTLTEEVFELPEVLDSCMSILRPQAELEGLRMREIREDFYHWKLRGSALHLRQILINIIGNAIKYNKKNGSITFETKELYEQDEKVWFRFVVSDTGIGINEEYLSRIFEPFTQADSGARTTYAGSGLGMAITKKLVDQMEGTIHVESTKGEGSVFTVQLPFAVVTRETVEEQEEGEANIQGMHVLVAEDNDVNREIAQYLLEEAGATVVTAENGKIALEKFKASENEEFDCIIMDVMMPVMDGLTAVKKIRQMKRPDARTIPVIALSANAFQEDLERSKEAGMDRHISKPLDAEQLFQVMNVLKKKRTQ